MPSTMDVISKSDDTSQSHHLFPVSDSQHWIDRPVAFVASTDNFGGLERIAVKLAQELTLRDVDVRFICRAGSPLSRRCSELNIPQFSVRIRNSADLQAAASVARYLSSESIGILHAHSRRDYVPAVLAVKMASVYMRRRTRLVLHVHQIRRLGDGGPFSDLFFNWGADKVLAVSGAVKNKLAARSLLKPKLAEVLTNGIDEKNYLPPDSVAAADLRAQTRKAWGFDDNARVIGMVGRLGDKGQEFVMRQIPELIKDFPDLKFVFVGPGAEETVQTLKQIAENNGSAGRIVIAGIHNHMPAAYAAMDLLVHLPVDEAFGLAIAEAMASSLPVIVSSRGGCTELVRHGETGIVIEPRSTKALIAAVRYVFSDDSAAAMQLGKMARLSIETDFTIERQVHKLLQCYDALVPGFRLNKLAMG